MVTPCKMIRGRAGAPTFEGAGMEAGSAARAVCPTAVSQCMSLSRTYTLPLPFFRVDRPRAKPTTRQNGLATSPPQRGSLRLSVAFHALPDPTNGERTSGGKHNAHLCTGKQPINGSAITRNGRQTITLRGRTLPGISLSTHHSSAITSDESLLSGLIDLRRWVPRLKLSFIQRGGGGVFAMQKASPLIIAQKLPELGIIVAGRLGKKAFAVAP